jgi:hypothetical protein
MKFAALALPLLFAATSATGADADTALGTFKSQTVTLDAKSAVAFRGPSSFDKSDALIVAVINARVRSDAIADYTDRRRVIDKRVKDGATGVVYFEFKPDGTYRGMSYYFGPGNGCGYCTGETTSTVKLVGGMLSGKLKETGTDRSFDITLVAPVLSDAHGAALPADGGAPGRAYLDYHAALVKADRGALKPLLSQDQQEYWASTEKDGNGGGFLHTLAGQHPNKSVRITQGFGTADKAVILFTGESTAGKVVGEALLLKQDGTWRVDDEITELAAP